MAPAQSETRTRVLSPRQSALVTGGARSGKSRFAEELLRRSRRVTYLATSAAGDEEMARRIEQHRGRRNPAWLTIEEPRDILQRIDGQATDTDAILVDCITIWLANLLECGLGDADVLERVDQLAAYLEKPRTRVVCVTNEVGSGIVPATPLGRRFRDLAGVANQRLAAACHSVYWLVSGIPVRVK